MPCHAMPYAETSISYPHDHIRSMPGVWRWIPDPDGLNVIIIIIIIILLIHQLIIIIIIVNDFEPYNNYNYYYNCYYVKLIIITIIMGYKIKRTSKHNYNDFIGLFPR